MNKNYNGFKVNCLKNFENEKELFIHDAITKIRNNSLEYKKLLKSFDDPFSENAIKKEKEFLDPIRKKLRESINYKTPNENYIKYMFAKTFWLDNQYFQPIDFNDDKIKEILENFNKAFNEVKNDTSKLITVLYNDDYLLYNNPFSILKTYFIQEADTVILSSYMSIQNNLFQNDFDKIDTLNEDDKKLLDTDYLMVTEFPNALTIYDEKSSYKYIDSMTRFFRLIKKRSLLNKITILGIKSIKKDKEKTLESIFKICVDNSNESFAELIVKNSLLMKFFK